MFRAIQLLEKKKNLILFNFLKNFFNMSVKKKYFQISG